MRRTQLARRLTRLGRGTEPIHRFQHLVIAPEDWPEELRLSYEMAKVDGDRARLNSLIELATGRRIRDGQPLRVYELWWCGGEEAQTE